MPGAFISFFFRFPAGAPYPVTFTFRLRFFFPSDVLQSIALTDGIFLSSFCFRTILPAFSLFFLLPFAKGRGWTPSLRAVSLQVRLDENSPGQVFPVRIHVQAEVRFSGRFSQPAIPVFVGLACLPWQAHSCVLIRVGVLHPFLIGHCHPVSEGARHPGIVPYHYCGYGAGCPFPANSFCRWYTFCFFLAVDEYRRRGVSFSR